MHSLLEKLLLKRGVKNTEDLTDENVGEKTTYERLNRELLTEVNLDYVKRFCDTKLKEIQSQLKNLDNSGQKNERLILLQNVYSAILEVINSPPAERLRAEKELEELLKL